MVKVEEEEEVEKISGDKIKGEDLDPKGEVVLGDIDHQEEKINKLYYIKN